jgi:hypothetical protein
MDCFECDLPYGGVIGRNNPSVGTVWLCRYCDRITPEYKGGN